MGGEQIVTTAAVAAGSFYYVEESCNKMGQNVPSGDQAQS